MEKFFLVLLMIFLRHMGFAQGSITDEYKYKVTYQLTYQPDSTDRRSITSEEMWLYVGEKISKFSSKGTAIKDSLANSVETSAGAGIDFKDRIRLTRTEFDYTIYKDFPEEKISYTLEIVNDFLRYEEDLDLQWDILPEIKIIRGFKSQKAKTAFRGRDYIAWFTSEIPIPEGPYKFHGLPGLILEIQDSKEDSVFKLIELKTLNKSIPVKLNIEQYMLTSKEKLLKNKREFEEDPLSGIEKRNPAVSISVENNEKRQYLKELQEKLEKKNNPIELE